MNGPSSVVQESTERITNSGPSAVSNVERSGWIGRYKLNLYAFAATLVGAAKACPGVQNVFNHFQVACLGDVEVDESRTGDITMRYNAVSWYPLNDSGG